MPSGLVGTIYTQSNSGVMENPYFKKLADFSHVHVDMWWTCPMWPKCAFGDQKGLIRTKDMLFGNPLIMGQNCGLYQFYFLLFMGPKVVFWVKNGVLGCLRPGVR